MKVCPLCLLCGVSVEMSIFLFWGSLRQTLSLWHCGFMTSWVSCGRHESKVASYVVLSQRRWLGEPASCRHRSVSPLSSTESHLTPNLPQDLDTVACCQVRNHKAHVVRVEPMCWFRIWSIALARVTDTPVLDKCQMSVRLTAPCHFLVSQNQRLIFFEDELLKRVPPSWEHGTGY